MINRLANIGSISINLFKLDSIDYAYKIFLLSIKNIKRRKIDLTSNIYLNKQIQTRPSIGLFNIRSIVSSDVK